MSDNSMKCAESLGQKKAVPIAKATVLKGLEKFDSQVPSGGTNGERRGRITLPHPPSAHVRGCSLFGLSFLNGTRDVPRQYSDSKLAKHENKLEA
jgi:hypothetical protein